MLLRGVDLVGEVPEGTAKRQGQAEEGHKDRVADEIEATQFFRDKERVGVCDVKAGVLHQGERGVLQADEDTYEYAGDVPNREGEPRNGLDELP